MTTPPLRIVTWNCNGALRKKWQTLDHFRADVHVIQECENPAATKDAAYQAWASNHLWVGSNKNKGLGVFARDGVTLEAGALDLAPHRLFLPCRVDGAPLLASWTQKAESSIPSYIGQLWGILPHVKGFLDHPHALPAGDLNSNAQWDGRPTLQSLQRGRHLGRNGAAQPVPPKQGNWSRRRTRGDILPAPEDHQAVSHRLCVRRSWLGAGACRDWEGRELVGN